MSISLEQAPAMEAGATKEDVERHVEAEAVPVKDGRRCVDGRYESDSEDSGRLARPGGDFGYVMALLAVNRNKGLGLLPEQCLDAVYDVVTEEGGQFFMHTDEHVEHTGGGHTIGCGHIAQAMHITSGADYKVTCDDVKQALAHTQRKMMEVNTIRMVSLSGQHEERGVLVVTGTEKTVNPKSAQAYNNMFFVYDRTRDAEFLAQLVERVNIKGLTLEDMAKAAQQQTEATLHLLAAGKPVFEVDLDSDVPGVEARGRIG